MTKSFVLLAFALGLMIFAQTCSADVQDSSDENEHEDDNEDEKDEDETEQNPAITCVLFGKQSCHIQCSIHAYLYGRTAHGDCTADNLCTCHSYSDTSFHQEWKKLFDAEYVYRKLERNDLTIDHILDIFRYPFRTAHNFKDLLRDVTSPYQFSKLKISKDAVTNKFTNEDGVVDNDAVSKLVVEKMKTLLKTRRSQALFTVDYKDRLRKALETSDGSTGTLYNYAYKISQLQNPSLQNILDEYLKENQIQKPEIDIVKKPGVMGLVNNVVVNELIKRNDETSQQTPKPVSPAPKRVKTSRSGSPRLPRKSS